MLGLIRKTVQTGLNVVTTPVDVVKDVVTLGGAMTDQEVPYTVKKIKRVCKDIDELPNSIKNGIY